MTFVGLAAITDPALVPATIAQAFDSNGGGRPPFARLVTAIGQRRLLLVLDNFEQVIMAAALITDLLEVCSDLTVLVTSRASLRLSGEHEFPVPPLAFPTTDRVSRGTEVATSPAVTLFVQRARAVQPAFEITDDNAASIAAICRALDGLPLAIELAAVRTKLLPPAAIQALLTDRLNVLTGGPRDRPTRQQTMRDAIAWSHDLLPVDQQALFRRLAVFAGGWTLAAARSVVGEEGTEALTLLDGLSALLDSSLLTRRTGAEGEPRFGMLETVREFAAERLAASDEAATTRRRHAAWCLDLAEQAATGFQGAIEASWVTVVEEEHDNLRAALTWLEHQGDATASLRLAGALWGFWYVRSHRVEARGWLTRALAAAPERPSLERASALVGLGEIEQALGNVDRGIALLENGLTIRRAAGDTHGTAEALLLLGAATQKQGKYDTATP